MSGPKIFAGPSHKIKSSGTIGAKKLHEKIQELMDLTRTYAHRNAMRELRIGIFFEAGEMKANISFNADNDDIWEDWKEFDL